MKNSKTYKLVLAALFSAMCLVATKVIQIPTPTGGYIHIGDGFVLLTGIVLGPVYGGISAAIGSMLADLLSGYPQYAVATFIIKGIVAAVAGVITKIVVYNHKGSRSVATIISGILGTIIVVSGYLSFEAILLGNGIAAAVSGIPTNMIQGGVGIAIACALAPTVSKLYSDYKVG